MKVTIIIPIYNVAPFVADCIHSVMCQTWQEPLECILVDDCGTDDSMAVVERTLQDYQGPVDFRIVRHEHNRGLSAARNTGLDNATGDYVYFLDSDDEVTPDCIGFGCSHSDSKLRPDGGRLSSGGQWYAEDSIAFVGRYGSPRTRGVKGVSPAGLVRDVC